MVTKTINTFRIFADMLKPSVGFKFVPMLWYEMMGVNKIVGFILPDWIADIIPGKYQFITQRRIKPNFKSKVLDIVTGDFEAFKIPVLLVIYGTLLEIISWSCFRNYS